MVCLLITTVQTCNAFISPNAEKGIWERADSSSTSNLTPNIALSSTAEKGIWERVISPLPVKLTPYGYIQLDAFFDSRQEVGEQEQEELLFPIEKIPDRFCRDIAAHPRLTITAIATRLGLLATGLDPWPGISCQARVEGDFRGTTQPINPTGPGSIVIGGTTVLPSPFTGFNGLVRLRHAYVELLNKEKKIVALFGQFWTPFFIFTNYPYTEFFHDDIPFPIGSKARQPQLRVLKRWGNFEILAAALSQSTVFRSFGPFGQSTEYIRNAVVPNLHGQLRGYFYDKLGGESLLALMIDFKRLVPRLFSVIPGSTATPPKNLLKVNESIDSWSTSLFYRYTNEPFNLWLQFIYSQNGADLHLISGYGVASVNPITGKQTYTNTQALSAWLDTFYTFGNQDLIVAFFAGGTKNIGAQHRLFIDPTTHQPIIFAFDPRLDYAIKISPRALVKRGPFLIGGKIEYLRAAFGNITPFGTIKNPVPVQMVRLWLTIFYEF